MTSITATALQQALFKYADKDKSGSLTTGELKTVASEILGTPNPSSTDVANLATALDSNKDGKLSESEFLQTSIATANANSLLDGGTMAALLSGSSGGATNPYAALAGYSGSTDVSNLYSSLVNTSLANSGNSTGALTGALEYGALTAKGLLV